MASDIEEEMRRLEEESESESDEEEENDEEDDDYDEDDDPPTAYQEHYSRDGIIFPQNYCNVTIEELEEKLRHHHIAYPHMIFNLNRLNSFSKRWSIQMKQKPYKMAEAGWFYEGTTSKTFCCGIEKDDWWDDDDVWTIHLRESKKVNKVQCKLYDIFLEGIEKEKYLTNTTVWDSVKLSFPGREKGEIVEVPFGKEVFDRDDIVSKDELANICTHVYDVDKMTHFDRMNTFENWNKQLIPNSQDLSDAGFFYTGENDSCRTFCCGIMVYDWEPFPSPMAPLYQHQLANKKCPVLPFFKHYPGLLIEI